MSYSYEAQKPQLFTDEGQRSFLKIRDHVKATLKIAGAIRCQEAMVGTGDSWTLLACIDRLVELKEIRRVTPRDSVATQYEIYVAGGASE